MVAILTFSAVDVNVAQVILESTIITALLLQPAKSAYMSRFVHMLIITLCIETSLMGFYAYVLHSLENDGLAIVIWELYKLVRLFLSLSLCYPMLVVLNHKVKLHCVFLLIASIIIGGGIINYMVSEAGKSTGFNNIAFMFIFAFTLQQYMKMKSRLPDADDSEIEGLNSLIAIEVSLVTLNGLLILLFFGGSTSFLQSLRLSITMIQYFKIYLLISLFASFKTVWNIK